MHGFKLQKQALCSPLQQAFMHIAFAETQMFLFKEKGLVQGARALCWGLESLLALEQMACAPLGRVGLRARPAAFACSQAVGPVSSPTSSDGGRSGGRGQLSQDRRGSSRPSGWTPRCLPGTLGPLPGQEGLSWPPRAGGDVALSTALCFCPPSHHHHHGLRVPRESGLLCLQVQGQRRTLRISGGSFTYAGSAPSAGYCWEPETSKCLLCTLSLCA